MLEQHLRVELLDDGHRDWPAVRRHMARSGGTGHLIEVGGRLSARQTVVAAFLDGRPVGHACVRVDTPDGRTLVARLDSRGVDVPFAGTTVEHVLMGVAASRARTMGCRGELLAPARPAAQPAA